MIYVCMELGKLVEQHHQNHDGTINTTYILLTQLQVFQFVHGQEHGGTSTVGHGLNAVPKMIIIKIRCSDNLQVGHGALGGYDGFYKNEQNAGTKIGHLVYLII